MDSRKWNCMITQILSLLKYAKKKLVFYNFLFSDS